MSRKEQVSADMQRLYKRFGYAPYKMSKFEEYDLYVRNKDFLISDGVITFTDTDGKLMALKPDVTLSIIKHSKYQAGCVQKTYYGESVYRVSEDAHCFKEILQTGVECMGDIDDGTLYEVLTLAMHSLKCNDRAVVLDVAHRGVVEDLLAPCAPTEVARTAVYRCLREKNPHELAAVCAEYGVPADTAAKLGRLIALYGKPEQVLPKLEALLGDTAPLRQLNKLTAGFAGGLDGQTIGDMLRIDFSVVDAGKYYNGIVFKGFVDGVPDAVLSGGQYDPLMQNMGRLGGAVGFAVYLDYLDREEKADDYDVDALILYDQSTDLSALGTERFTGQYGNGSVMFQKAIPEGLTYRTLYRIENGEVKPL